MDTKFGTRPFGGSSNKVANAIIQTSDGGYALAGQTHSKGLGKYNVWLVKYDL